MELTLFKEYQDYSKNDGLSIEKDEMLKRIKKYYFSNDKNDLNNIVKSFQNLIIKLAYQWQKGTNQDVMDIIQEANLALVDALVNHKYDVNSGNAPSTYFQTTLFNRVFKYLGKNSSQFSLTGYTPVKLSDAKKIEYIKYQQRCTDEEAIKIYKKKNKKSLIKNTKDLNKYSKRTIYSLDEPVKDSNCDDLNLKIADTIKDEQPSVEQQVQEKLILEEIVKTLDKRSFNIFYDKFVNDYSSNELQLKYNLSIEEINKIINNSKKLLKNNKVLQSC